MLYMDAILCHMLPHFSGVPMTRSMLLALCIAASLTAAARGDVLPTHLLPLPLGAGGSGGFFGPHPSTADLAAHLRGTLLLTSQDGGPEIVGEDDD